MAITGTQRTDPATHWRRALSIALLSAAAQADGESAAIETSADAHCNGSPCSAESSLLRIDPARSEALFSIGLMLFFDAKGHFEQIDGEIRRRDGQVEVLARIPVAGARMDSERWQAMLQGPKFLSGEAHPLISFDSDPLPIEQLEAGSWIPGQLCLRGVCQQERFHLHELFCRPAAAGLPERCEVIVSGSLERTRYGMRSHRGALKNRIELRLRLVAEGEIK